MSFLSRIFGGKPGRARYEPLYRSIVAKARDPSWYRDGGVPDTIDGRFDMIVAVLALVLLRLERDGRETSEAAALLAELFIEDMEGTVRQLGIGDLMVGKHVGNMMGAVGGRLTAFREAIESGSGFEAPVRRNIFRDSPLSEEAVRSVAERLERFHNSLGEAATADILGGKIPGP